jgi:aspartyl-tRNA(Asn)/glutamyl-tRNA(Gln) amidotransferase subunit A
MTDTALAFASIEEVARLYRKRKVSPVEVTKLLLARIERLNPKLNAFITVTPEQALAQAKKAESELFARRRRDRGPLHGIPISLKDNIYTKGIRTTAGSKILKDFIPDRDAAVWSILKDAGAILLGKTNLHEFAYGVTTNNPHYGPTRNPWDLARIPGGSSGGSAAAVAAGLCYGSIGTDTGGSIRIPASLCGVVGIKPGIGRVPSSEQDGVVPLSPTLDFVGPLARTISDAVALLDPIFLYTEKDPPLRKLPKLSSRIRLGIPKEFFFDIVSDEVIGVYQQAIRHAEKRGATIRQVSIPMLSETQEAGNDIAWPEATYYHRKSGWFPTRAAEYGEDVRTRLEMGDKVLATTYLQALEKRQKFIEQLTLAMLDTKVDALVVPTTPIVAPLIGEESTAVRGKNHPTRALLLRLNRPANFAGVPAVSVPCGFTPAGLPVGLQLVGLATKERALLTLARVFEDTAGKRPSYPLRDP